MTRGANLSSYYTFNSWNERTTGSTEPVARMILNRFIGSVGHQNVIGSPLIGYDIKSQDSLTMIRLSLLAEDPEGFPELYTRPDGIVVKVSVGKTEAPAINEDDILIETKTTEYVEKIDHVLVRGRSPLPARYSRPSVNAIGAGVALWFDYNCYIGYNFKNEASKDEAWAEYEKSLQHPDKQEELKSRVRRSNWEELVGYKAKLPSLPKHVAFSPSQTTPRGYNLVVTKQFEQTLTIPLGDSSTPEGGALMDVSGLTAIGTPILEIITGLELKQNSYTSSQSGEVKKLPDAEWEALLAKEGLTNRLTETDLYVLLGAECSVYSVSRGENWFLLPGSDTTAVIMLRNSPSSYLSTKLDAHGYSTTYLRSNVNSINAIRDGVQFNINSNNRVFAPLGDGMGTTISTGVLIPGIGGTHGLEVTSLTLAYSIDKPSFKIQSHYNDAKYWASKIANGGFSYTPIVVQEKPPPTGWSQDGAAHYPPTPADKEGEKYDVEWDLDQLEGSIVEVSAPFLGELEVGPFAQTIKNLINKETGLSANLSLKFGGYNVLPGMRLTTGGFTKTVEFNYSDRDIQATNLTTGPQYHPIGSYQDSQYVKRTESISRDGRVIAGSNKTGTFLVSIPNLGLFEAINSNLEAIYPGDRVQVTVNNYPVEK